jgi:CRISPR/Cas system-associated exonuclease Cas4 (RecB family)
VNLTYNDELHEYRLDGAIIPSTTQVLDAEGFIDTTFMNDEGRKRGSMVHLAVKYLLEDRLDMGTLDPRIYSYVGAARAFINDMGYKPQIIEEPMSHPIYRYGMTPDTIGTVRQFGEELVLIDWKTGAKDKATVIQMASYVEGLRANGIEVKHVYIIYLKDDGTYKPELVKVTRKEINVFLYALTCMNWKNNNLKRRKR